MVEVLITIILFVNIPLISFGILMALAKANIIKGNFRKIFIEMKEDED